MGQIYHSTRSQKKGFGENLGEGNTGHEVIEQSLRVIRNWYRNCEMIVLEEIEKSDVEEDEMIRFCIQMLWKKTTSIDCASQKNNGGGVYVVCQYYPPISFDKTEINENIIASSDWTVLNPGSLVQFDFSSSGLQIKTEYLKKTSEKLQIYFFYTENTVIEIAIDILLFVPIGIVHPNAAISSSFCTHYKTHGTAFLSHKTKSTILYTFILTSAELSVFVNGVEFLIVNIPDAVNDEHCKDQIAKTVSEGKISFEDRGDNLKMAMTQYRAMLSSRLPSPAELVVAPELTTAFKTEIVTEVINITTKEGQDNYRNQSDTSKHYIIRDKSGQQVKVVFPSISTTFQDRGDGSLTVYMDHDEPFSGITSFQLIIQHHDHGDLSVNDEPLSFSDTLYEWQDAEKIYRNSRRSVPYITAEVPELSDVFVVGDEMTYGGYYNGRVDNGKEYSLRVRGIVELSDEERAVIDTGVVGVFNSSWTLTVGSLMTLLVVLSGFLAFHFTRKRRERRRVEETIAKFNTYLADTAYPDSGSTSGIEDQGEGNQVRGSGVAPAPPILATTSEWWDISGSDTPRNTDE